MWVTPKEFPILFRRLCLSPRSMLSFIRVCLHAVSSRGSGNGELLFASFVMNRFASLSFPCNEVARQSCENHFDMEYIDLADRNTGRSTTIGRTTGIALAAGWRRPVCPRGASNLASYALPGASCTAGVTALMPPKGSLWLRGDKRLPSPRMPSPRMPSLVRRMRS